MGLYYDKGNKLLNFQGFIQVPFRHEDFTAFDEDQQKAICQANLNKAGLPINVDSCDPFCFYKEQNQVNNSKKDIVEEIEGIKSFIECHGRNLDIDNRIRAVVNRINTDYIEHSFLLSKCFVGSHDYDEFAVRQLRKIKDVYSKSQPLFDKYNEDSVKLAREFNWDLNKDEVIDEGFESIPECTEA